MPARTERSCFCVERPRPCDLTPFAPKVNRGTIGALKAATSVPLNSQCALTFRVSLLIIGVLTFCHNNFQKYL